MGKQIMEKKEQTVPKPKLLSYPSVSSHYAIQNFHYLNGIGMTLVVCALACGAAVLGLLVFRRYCRQKRAGKSHHTFSVESFQSQWGAGPSARNVVYDEIVLPPTSSSSSSSSTVIPTEPNAAYATTTRVARHHHSS